MSNDRNASRRHVAPSYAHRLVCALVIFLGGWNSTVPISATSEVPAAFRPMILVPGVPLEQAIMLCVLPVIGLRRTRSSGNRGGRIAAALLTLLGCLGVVSNWLNGAPVNEMGEATRLVAFAAFLACYWRWTSDFGTKFALGAVVAGLAAGGVTNICFSIAQSESFVGKLPLLLGQAGPGAALGLLTILAAWTYALARGGVSRFGAVVAGVIGCCGTVMSFSKIGLLMTAAGLVAWGCLVWTTVPRGRFLALAAAVAATIALPGVLLAGELRPLIRDAVRVVATKFSAQDMDVSDRDSDIRGTRLLFWPATAEIVRDHPIAGVGYAGFANAYNQTKTAADPRAYQEVSGGSGSSDSNPHCTILYYASANGIPGFLAAVALLLVMQRILWRGSRAIDPPMRPIGWALVASMLLWSLTLPDLYESTLVLSIVGVASATDRAGRNSRARHVGAR